MVKHLSGYEILQKLPCKPKVYVCNFPGAETMCMKNYLKPSLRENPDSLIFHMEANDPNSEQSPKHIAKLIADLAASLKNEKQNVSISDN